jgi:hypothetical protein
LLLCAGKRAFAGRGAVVTLQTICGASFNNPCFLPKPWMPAHSHPRIRCVRAGEPRRGCMRPPPPPPPQVHAGRRVAAGLCVVLPARRRRPRPEAQQQHPRHAAQTPHPRAVQPPFSAAKPPRRTTIVVHEKNESSHSRKNIVRLQIESTTALGTRNGTSMQRGSCAHRVHPMVMVVICATKSLAPFRR